jgi:hypothetical protein
MCRRVVSETGGHTVAIDQHFNDLPSQTMAVFAGASGYQIAVDHEVLVDKPGAVRQRIVVEIVVAG